MAGIPTRLTVPKNARARGVQESQNLQEVRQAVRKRFKEGDRVRVVVGRFNPLVETESYVEGTEGTVIKSPAGSSVVQLRLHTPDMQEVFVSQLHLDVTKKAHRGSLDGTPESHSSPTSPLHGLGKALTGLDMFTRFDTPEDCAVPGGQDYMWSGDPDDFIKNAHAAMGSPDGRKSPLRGSPQPDKLADAAGFDRVKRSSDMSEAF